MPIKYKILLLDIDGTTVANSSDALPSEKVVTAVRAAQSRLHVALATGRPFHLAKPVIDCLGLHGLSIFNGGAEIIDIDSGSVRFRQTLSVSTLRSLISLALPTGYKIYIHDDPSGTPIRSPEEVNNESAQLLIEAVNKSDVLTLLGKLSSIGDVARSYNFKNLDTNTATYSTDSWRGADVVDIHIVHTYGTKKYGVERLLKMLSINKEESIAIGDGQNDVPLLEAAGLKIAMGNAPSEVKGLADYIAPSLADDGVAEAINHFIFDGNLWVSAAKRRP